MDKINKINKISFLIKNIIKKNKTLYKSYFYKHPNSKYNIDIIIKDIIYVLQNGISWRNIRTTIHWNSLYQHFLKLSKHNIFKSLFNKLKNKYINSFIVNNNNNNFLLDSTVIYNVNGIDKLGRNKFYKNKKCCKLSLLTDEFGFPLSFYIFKGNLHDNYVFDKHLNDMLVYIPNNKTLLADKAYSNKYIYNVLDVNNIKHIIPPTKNMKIYNSYCYNKKEYLKRIKIENVFAHLKQFKRIKDRNEKSLNSYKAFLYMALSFLCLKFIYK